MLSCLYKVFLIQEVTIMRPDSKFFSFMSCSSGDIILLNVLFIITSLPVVTAGVSLTALYASLKKRIHGHESYAGQRTIFQILEGERQERH